MLWIEEAGPKCVWHAAVRGTRGLRRTAYCGWEMNLERGRLWPQKAGEAGPAHEERCHSCVAEIERRQ